MLPSSWSRAVPVLSSLAAEERRGLVMVGCWVPVSRRLCLEFQAVSSCALQKAVMIRCSTFECYFLRLWLSNCMMKRKMLLLFGAYSGTTCGLQRPKTVAGVAGGVTMERLDGSRHGWLYRLSRVPTKPR